MNKKQLCWVFGAIAVTSFFMLCTGISEAVIPMGIALAIVGIIIGTHDDDPVTRPVNTAVLTDMFAEFLANNAKAENGDKVSQIKANKLASNIIDTLNQYLNNNE